MLGEQFRMLYNAKDEDEERTRLVAALRDEHRGHVLNGLDDRADEVARILEEEYGVDVNEEPAELEARSAARPEVETAALQPPENAAAPPAKKAAAKRTTGRSIREEKR